MTALAHIGSRIEAAPFVASLDAALADTISLTERVRLIRAAITGRIAFSTSLGIEGQAIWAVVSVDAAKLSGKSKRVNITLPERVLNLMDKFASDNGETRSGLITQATLEYIASHEGTAE